MNKVLFLLLILVPVYAFSQPITVKLDRLNTFYENYVGKTVKVDAIIGNKFYKQGKYFITSISNSDSSIVTNDLMYPNGFCVLLTPELTSNFMNEYDKEDVSSDALGLFTEVEGKVEHLTITDAYGVSNDYTVLMVAKISIYDDGNGSAVFSKVIH